MAWVWGLGFGTLGETLTQKPRSLRAQGQTNPPERPRVLIFVIHMTCHTAPTLRARDQTHTYMTGHQERWSQAQESLCKFQGSGAIRDELGWDLRTSALPYRWNWGAGSPCGRDRE